MNVSLSKKIFLGFGTISFLMITVGAIAYVALQNSIKGFDMYKNMSISSNLAGNLQEKMLLVQLHSTKLLKGRDSDYMKKYGDYWNDITNTLDELKANETDAKEREMVNEITQALTTFNQQFTTTRFMAEECDAVLDKKLNPLSRSIEQKLMDIIKSSRNDTSSAVYAGEALRAFMFVKADISDFINVNGEFSMDKCRKLLADMTGTLTVLGEEVESEKARGKVYEIIDQNCPEFEKIVANVVNLVNKRDLFINKKLHLSMANAVKGVDAINIELRERQKKLGPSLAASNKSALRNIIMIIVGSSVVGMVLTLIMNTNIAGDLGRLVQMAERISHGDLSRRSNTKRNDEVGKLARSFDTMAESLSQKERSITIQFDQLNSVLDKIKLSSRHVSGYSNSLQEASQSLFSGSNRQKEAMQEITSAMTQLENLSKEASEIAMQTRTVSGNAVEETEEGLRHIEEMRQAVGSMTRSGKKISKIVSTIDDIAFQTNILALNASVEAARAGKHGKGFAVVAEEVRSLAAECAKAAGETSQLIQNSVNDVEHGEKIADKVSGSFQKIRKAIENTTRLTRELSDITPKQVDDIMQINHELQKIQNVNEQNSILAGKTASNAERLNDQSLALNSICQNPNDKTTDDASKPRDGKNEEFIVNRMATSSSRLLNLDMNMWSTSSV